MSNVLLQPMVIDLHPMGNPWTNYSIYLSNSFVPAALELMIFLVTVFSICQEIKTKRSIEWLAQANGSVVKALFGKLFPQTIIFTAVGFAIQALFYGFSHFPLNGSTGNMLLAMFLFVVACQSFGVIISSALPNLRLALSVCSLSGILAFSIAGFSFPVDQMYGAIGIFSYILPVRWYFLIYIDQALNGIPLYYSRIYYAVLLAFPLCVIPLLWHLKRYIAKPVYIP